MCRHFKNSLVGLHANLVFIDWINSVSIFQPSSSSSFLLCRAAFDATLSHTASKHRPYYYSTNMIELVIGPNVFFISVMYRDHRPYMSTLRHSYGDSVILASLKISVTETKMSAICDDHLEHFFSFLT